MARYRTYILRIESFDSSEDNEPLTLMDASEVFKALQNAEDIVNDALPEGMYCKIDEHGRTEQTDV